mmetsp:Transcript_16758/g.41270  ORF Transcript_16758/g.41270 Transcript_16758/m.41270 type:complete len:244 (-) Transcript_16758:160-891(-)
MSRVSSRSCARTRGSAMSLGSVLVDCISATVICGIIPPPILLPIAFHSRNSSANSLSTASARSSGSAGNDFLLCSALILRTLLLRQSSTSRCSSFRSLRLPSWRNLRSAASCCMRSCCSSAAFISCAGILRIFALNALCFLAISASISLRVIKSASMSARSSNSSSLSFSSKYPCISHSSFRSAASSCHICLKRSTCSGAVKSRELKNVLSLRGSSRQSASSSARSTSFRTLRLMWSAACTDS